MLSRTNRFFKLLSIILCISLVLGAVSFLSRKPIKAVDRGFLSYTPSQQDIDDYGL